MAAQSRSGGHTPRWRVLPDDAERSPEVNLAREEALAACAGGAPALRLWRSDRCVVLGRAQLAEAEADLAACRELGIPVLRRFTGGGAVYHDPGNLNVTLVVARDDELVRSRATNGPLPGVYGLVLEPLAAAVRALGAPAVADARAIWIRERKVSGVAAWLGARAVLIHATLLVDSDLDVLERVLAGPGAPGNPRWERTRSRRVPVTSLAREGGAPDPAAIADAVVNAFVEQPGNVREPGRFTADELAAAARLLTRRYTNPLWHAAGRDAERG
jgi:lipoate-protein ligase A